MQTDVTTEQPNYRATGRKQVEATLNHLPNKLVMTYRPENNDDDEKHFNSGAVSLG